MSVWSPPTVSCASTSDSDPLGPAPQPGQVEQFAAYRAAWRALGRPETDREELELSDGQLRMRVRAAERETRWAPRYVGNELAGTRQAAEHHRHTAALRRAEGHATTDTQLRARLQEEAAQAQALASALDRQVDQLEQLDEARSRWLAHTAATRAAGERAQAELALRHANHEPEQHVTAEEWLTAHEHAQRLDDAHREITAEHELIDHDAVDHEFVHQLPAQPDAPADIREITAAEQPEVGEDAVRVPTADETAAALERAHRAVAEINARTVYDHDHDHDLADRAAQLTTWHEHNHDHDHTAEQLHDEALDHP